jgi:hypothetical protein
MVVPYLLFNLLYRTAEPPLEKNPLFSEKSMTKPVDFPTKPKPAMIGCQWLGFLGNFVETPSCFYHKKKGGQS